MPQHILDVQAGPEGLEYVALSAAVAFARWRRRRRDDSAPTMWTTYPSGSVVRHLSLAEELFAEQGRSERREKERRALPGHSELSPATFERRC